MSDPESKKLQSFVVADTETLLRKNVHIPDAAGFLVRLVKMLVLVLYMIRTLFGLTQNLRGQESTILQIQEKKEEIER